VIGCPCCIWKDDVRVKIREGNSANLCDCDWRSTSRAPQSHWDRHYLPRSGYNLVDIDGVWSEWGNKTNSNPKWMILEIKRGCEEVSYPEELALKFLDDSIKNSSSVSARGYCGAFVVRFENSSPDDGKIWINDREVSREQYIAFRLFKLSGLDK
jgi:hypothetical protein